MEEKFKMCQFSTRYLIGNNGTVKRRNPEIIKRYGTDVLLGMVKPDGYKLYYLDGKWYYAHRLVATHYIPNPCELTDVNHRDGDKLNNWWLNLEWLSHADNIRHSYDILGRKAPSGKDHYNYGKTINKQSKEAMSEAKRGEKHPKFKGYYCYNGVQYGSASELAKVNNTYGKNVKRLAMAGINGYSFIPK